MSRRVGVAVFVIGCLLASVSITLAVVARSGGRSHAAPSPSPSAFGTSVPAAGSPSPSAPAPARAFDRVVIVVLENRSLDSVLGSSSAPYLNALGARYSIASNYLGVAHPSLPNYLALTGGSTFGIDSDCTSCWLNDASIADRFEEAGLQWKAYEEGLPEPCYVGSAYPYAQKHDPFVYYTPIRQDAARCSHIVPMNQLATDFASASTTPAYSFVTPDMCHDGHDCTTAESDRWLAGFVPALFATPGFRDGRSLLVVTYDEAEGSNPRVMTVLAGPSVKSGYRSSTPYDHYSLLRTVEDDFGFSPLATGDASARAMNEFFVSG